MAGCGEVSHTDKYYCEVCISCGLESPALLTSDRLTRHSDATGQRARVHHDAASGSTLHFP